MNIQCSCGWKRKLPSGSTYSWPESVKCGKCGKEILTRTIEPAFGTSITKIPEGAFLHWPMGDPVRYGPGM